MFRPFAELARLWKTSSLRTQLVVMTSGLMLVTVVVTAALTASLFRQELVRQIDEDLFLNRNNVSYYLLDSLDASTPYTFSPQSILRFYGELQDNEGRIVANTSLPGSTVDAPDIPELTAEQVAARGNAAFELSLIHI